MIKVICDKCKKEAKSGYIEGHFILKPDLGEFTKSYQLHFCPRCASDIETKIELEGFDRL